MYAHYATSTVVLLILEAPDVLTSVQSFSKKLDRNFRIYFRLKFLVFCIVVLENLICKRLGTYCSQFLFYKYINFLSFTLNRDLNLVETLHTIIQETTYLKKKLNSPLHKTSEAIYSVRRHLI